MTLVGLVPKGNHHQLTHPDHFLLQNPNQSNMKEILFIFISVKRWTSSLD